MIKARLGDMLVLGIEERNVEKLRAKQPIVLHVRELGPAGAPPIQEIMLFYGTDFQDMVKQLKDSGAIPPDMEVPEPRSYKEGPKQ